MKFIKWLLVGLLVLGVLVGVYFAFGSYSEGIRAGTISKLSRKGVAFKTVEGQLSLGALSDDNAGSPATSLWNFSVKGSEDKIIKELENANLNGQRIRLYYKEKFYRLPWQGDTRYFIYKVETPDGKVVE